MGYHLNNFHDAVKGISTAPLPHISKAAAAATKPMAPKTRCPVKSIKTIVENIKIAIAS